MAAGGASLTDIPDRLRIFRWAFRSNGYDPNLSAATGRTYVTMDVVTGAVLPASRWFVDMGLMSQQAGG
ncbi:hypothetical protein GCM10023075_46950 [Streptosporangium album]